MALYSSFLPHSYFLRPEGKSFEVKRQCVRVNQQIIDKEAQNESERRGEVMDKVSQNGIFGGAIRVGDVVTFSYKNANAYPPVRVMIERVRDDLEWRDVVLSHLKDARKAQHLNSNLYFPSCFSAYFFYF